MNVILIMGKNALDCNKQPLKLNTQVKITNHKLEQNKTNWLKFLPYINILYVKFKVENQHSQENIHILTVELWKSGSKLTGTNYVWFPAVKEKHHCTKMMVWINS